MVVLSDIETVPISIAQRSYLSNESASTISWIGSLQIALQFIVGVISGTLFDKGYFHVLMGSGSVLLLFSRVILFLERRKSLILTSIDLSCYRWQSRINSTKYCCLKALAWALVWVCCFCHRSVLSPITFVGVEQPLWALLSRVGDVCEL
jgi:hypothetical protein